MITKAGVESWLFSPCNGAKRALRVVALESDHRTPLKSVIDSWDRIKNSRSNSLCGSVVLESGRTVEAVLSRVRDSEYQEYEVLVRMKVQEMKELSDSAWPSALNDMESETQSYLSK
jgi:hypothetical protein